MKVELPLLSKMLIFSYPQSIFGFSLSLAKNPSTHFLETSSNAFGEQEDAQTTLKQVVAAEKTNLIVTKMKYENHNRNIP